MDRSDQDNQAERPSDKPISAGDTTHDLDESMLDAEGINRSTRVASLPPQTPRPQPAQRPLPPLTGLPVGGGEDIEMTAPPSPRPRPATIVPQLVRSNETYDDNEESDKIEQPATTSSRVTRRAPILPPGRIDGLDFAHARRYLRRAVELDSHGQYNQALKSYTEALALYRPALNSITMSSGSRRALERTLAPHHERVIDLEEAQVYDETEPDKFMVDPSRVTPLSNRTNLDPRFELPGIPASMVRPELIGEGPDVEAEDGVDQYMLDLQKMYGRDGRSRPRSRAGSAPMVRESSPRKRECIPMKRESTPMKRESTPIKQESTPMVRQSTPIPRAGRRDSGSTAQSAQSAPARMDPSREATPSPDNEIESIRERAGTPLPGDVENFENRHPKRGLATYGSIHGTQSRMRQYKRPKIMHDAKGVLGTSASKSFDKQIAIRIQEEANGSHWMQDLFWDHRSTLHGQLAKGKYRDLRDIRKGLAHQEGFLIDRDEEEDNEVVPGWRQHRNSAAPWSSDIKACAKCGVTSKPEGGPVYPCVVCWGPFYCSMKCQDSHADVHQPHCMPNWQSFDREAQNQKPEQAQSTPGLADRLASLRDRPVELDIHKIAQDANRTDDQPVGDRTDLRRALVSGDIDMDEYMDKAIERGEVERESSPQGNDNVSSPGSDMAAMSSPKTPKAPEDVDLKGVGGAFDIQQAGDNLLSMQSSLGSGRGAAALRPAKKLPNFILRPPKPPTRNERELQTHEFEQYDGKHDKDADHESLSSDDDADDVDMFWQEPPLHHSERQAQEEMYPKRITDFRIEMNGGRTLEYLVSDARRDKEWCKAGTLLGPSW